MKISKASRILKHIIATLSSMAKAKTLDLKSKTRLINSRLLIFSLLHRKKFLMVSSLSHSIQQRKSSISQKFRALLGHNDKHSQDEDDVYVSDQTTHAIVPYKDTINAMSIDSLPDPTHLELFEDKYYGYLDETDEKDEEKYLDFDDQDPVDSMIELVKNSKEEAGEELSLELKHDIDLVADIFIKRFHRQMRMQKQLSFSDVSEDIDAAKCVVF